MLCKYFKYHYRTLAFSNIEISRLLLLVNGIILLVLKEFLVYGKLEVIYFWLDSLRQKCSFMHYLKLNIIHTHLSGWLLSECVG